jgi:hypothetical protein
MVKAKPHYYFVDNLDANRGEIITRGLRAVTSIVGVKHNLSQSIVEVVSATGSLRPPRLGARPDLVVKGGRLLHVLERKVSRRG